MLSILEEKVNDKIIKIGRKKDKLSRKLTSNFELELEINELLDAYDDIKKSKKDMILYAILDIILVLFIFDPLCTVGAIYMTIAFLIERSNIKENRSRIFNSDYMYSKNQENLEEKLLKVELRKEEIKKLIYSENRKMEKYQKIQKEIQYVKDIQNNVNDENFKILKDLYSEVPVLAFNTNEEYKNYLSYDDEFIKDEIINSKILSKKHK